jgi:hypothetical protein
MFKEQFFLGGSMNVSQSVYRVPQWQDYLGKSLMVLAALGANFAFISSLESVRVAPANTVWVETWRMFRFLVFAGLFAILALRPRHSAGVWELVFFHKLAMVVTALSLSGAGEAGMSGIVDAVLVGFLVIAYFCTRGWLSWRKP